MAEEVTYSIIVMRSGDRTPLFMRQLRVYSKDLRATEMKGMQIGAELARDAIHHAGLWEEFECQRKKS